jgi:hypothetical protein
MKSILLSKIRVHRALSIWVFHSHAHQFIFKQTYALSERFCCTSVEVQICLSRIFASHPIIPSAENTPGEISGLLAGSLEKAVDSRTLMSLNQCMLQSHQSEPHGWMVDAIRIEHISIDEESSSFQHSIPWLSRRLLFSTWPLPTISRQNKANMLISTNAFYRKPWAYTSSHITHKATAKTRSVNNIALIHNDLNNTEMSKKCLEYMLSELMLLVHCGKGDHLQCVDGFLWNISWKTCPAAAA